MIELALTACGLEAEEGSTNPEWISEVIERPESQDMGRWHWLTSDDSNSVATANVLRAMITKLGMNGLKSILQTTYRT